MGVSRTSLGVGVAVGAVLQNELSAAGAVGAGLQNELIPDSRYRWANCLSARAIRASKPAESRWTRLPVRERTWNGPDLLAEESCLLEFGQFADAAPEDEV